MMVLFDASNYENIFVIVYGFIYRFYLPMYVVFVISSFSKVKENLCSSMFFLFSSASVRACELFFWVDR